MNVRVFSLNFSFLDRPEMVAIIGTCAWLNRKCSSSRYLVCHDVGPALAGNGVRAPDTHVPLLTKPLPLHVSWTETLVVRIFVSTLFTFQRNYFWRFVNPRLSGSAEVRFKPPFIQTFSTLILIPFFIGSAQSTSSTWKWTRKWLWLVRQLLSGLAFACKWSAWLY